MKKIVITAVILTFTTIILSCDVFNNEMARTPPLPPAPDNLFVTPIFDANVALVWEATSGEATAIVIERRESLESSGLMVSGAVTTGDAWGPWVEIANLQPTVISYTDRSTSCGKKYEYQVCAVGEKEGRSCSPPAHAATPLCPPKNLTAAFVSLGKIELNWTDNSPDELWFQVFRKTAPYGPWQLIDAVPADNTTYSDTGITCGNYLYKVRAINEDWESGYSNETSVRTRICSPNGGDCYVWLVNDDATGSSHGLTWEDAFTHPQDAMDAANSCDMIWVAEGTYTRPIGGNEPVLTMKDGVSIYGGFTAVETSIAQRGDTSDNPTILDGEDISDNVVIGASDIILDGFTITRGNTLTTVWRRGGGMLNLFVSNVSIANCIFSNNFAEQMGGAIFNRNTSDITITNCVFDNNEAQVGGALYNEWNNSVIVANCYFSNNLAWDNDSYAWNEGGAILSQGSNLVVRNSIFFNNVAKDKGGAIHSNQVEWTPIENCLFVGNTAGEEGGAIYKRWGNVQIINCSIIGNSAVNYGGGIYSQQTDSPSVVTNSILWGNNSSVGAEIFHSGDDVMAISYSIVATGGIEGNPLFISLGAGILEIDPKFADPAGGDFHLQPGSPAIDTGTATGAPADDLDGNPRPSGAGYDMGAYEYQWP